MGAFEFTREPRELLAGEVVAFLKVDADRLMRICEIVRRCDESFEGHPFGHLEQLISVAAKLLKGAHE